MPPGGLQRPSEICIKKQPLLLSESSKYFLFTSQWCPKSFSSKCPHLLVNYVSSLIRKSKLNLKVHAITPTGEKPFTCDECLESFSSKCPHLLGRIFEGSNPTFTPLPWQQTGERKDGGERRRTVTIQKHSYCHCHCSRPRRHTLLRFGHDLNQILMNILS